MDAKEVVKRIMEDYERITGLRSYVVYDNTIIQSASERNYFCKCLKLSGKALQECERCTQENYTHARSIDKECVYSCHAGLIKWAVPIDNEDFHCVIISEGILSGKQREDAEAWADYLSKTYQVERSMLLKNYKVIKTMSEKQMNASIRLLKDLIAYYFSFEHVG